MKPKAKEKVVKEKVAKVEEKALIVQGEKWNDDRISPVESVKWQMATINELYRSVMQEDVHYGTIPGTQKPTLYQAGAQKIMFMFKLTPSYDLDKEWVLGQGGSGHLNVTVKCTLRNRDTEKFWGEGVGSASTMEKKHRYRESLEAVKPVPKGYWDTKDQALLEGMRPRKIDGAWMLCKVEKVENPDLADVYNTVLKMAKKRALVDAISTVTGVSDIFTQDMEDFIETPKDVSRPMDFPEKPDVKKEVVGKNQILEKMKEAKSIGELVVAAAIGKKFIKDHPDKFTDADKAELDEIYKDMTKKLKGVK
jgi:hypothetical protein